MKIHSVEEILNDLDQCIIDKKPFSLIRWGDGGIKYIEAILNNDKRQLEIIIEKEGLNQEIVMEIFEAWGYYARHANYIDTPEVYFHDTFWPRLRSLKNPMTKQTERKLKNWRFIYNQAEFDNENFCNPEFNYLMIINRPNKRNLFNIIKNRKILIITPYPTIKNKLREYDITTIKIPKQFDNHYKKSFERVTRIIKRNITKYDLCLVSGGELGRCYSGLIKEYGGRTLDIGFVSEFWNSGLIHDRLKPYVKVNPDNKLELILTSRAQQYEKYI